MLKEEFWKAIGSVLSLLASSCPKSLSLHNYLTILLCAAVWFAAILSFLRKKEHRPWTAIRIACLLPLCWSLAIMVFNFYNEWTLLAYMMEAEAFSEPQRTLYVQDCLLGKVRTILFGSVGSMGLWRFFDSARFSNKN